MTWYRKKPVAVEAVKASVLMHDAEHQWEHLPPWIKAAYDLSDVTFTGERILIRTLEGVMAAGREDWVIKGVVGEIYPCKNAVFVATYEPVD